MSLPQWYEENHRLISHIAEESENIVTPMNIRGFCAEYRNKNNAETSSVLCLARRIERFRNKIHELDCFNTEMKVKMLFALSASIDEQFLKELRKEATVELDDRNRIIRFERGGVVIQGKHCSRHNSEAGLKLDRSMLNMFANYTNRASFPIRFIHFIRNFKAATGCQKIDNYLRDRFSHLKGQIHAATEYDIHTRARMIFYSSASVDDEFLAELRINALVEIDNEKRITRYETYDGLIELDGEHRCWTPRRMSEMGVQVKREVMDDDSEEPDEEEEEVEVTKMVRKREMSPKPSSSQPKKPRFATPFCHHPIPISPSDSLEDVVESNTQQPLHQQLKVKQEIDTTVHVVDENLEVEAEDEVDDGFDYEVDQREPNHGDDVFDFGDVQILENQEEEEVIVEEVAAFEGSDNSSLPHLENDSDSSDNSGVVEEEQNAAQSDMQNNNGKEILELLRGLTLTLNSPILSNLCKMIEKEIEEYQSGNVKMSTQYIIMGLRIALRAFSNDARPTELTEASISIRGFLMMLSYGLINLNRSYLKEFQREVSDVIRSLNYRDKSISLKTFETVMTTVIIALSSGTHSSEK